MPHPWNHTTTGWDDVSFLKTEPTSVYRAQASEYLSTHQLADFRKSPLLYRRRQQGLVADADRPAFMVGRAAHCLILEGRDAFDRDYVVGGPINPKTENPYGGTTKAFREWAAAQQRDVLTDEQYDLVLRLASSVVSHSLARELLSDGVSERVVRAVYHGRDCQVRFDWFDAHRGIVDLKTADALDWFEADARRFGYVHQLAFYRAVLAEVIGVQMPVHFIAVEKHEPYRCGVWQVPTEALDIARQENERAIERLIEYETHDCWPTGYEELRVLGAVA